MCVCVCLCVLVASRSAEDEIVHPMFVSVLTAIGGIGASPGFCNLLRLFGRAISGCCRFCCACRSCRRRSLSRRRCSLVAVVAPSEVDSKSESGERSVAGSERRRKPASASRNKPRSSVIVASRAAVLLSSSRLTSDCPMVDPHDTMSVDGVIASDSSESWTLAALFLNPHDEVQNVSSSLSCIRSSLTSPGMQSVRRRCRRSVPWRGRSTMCSGAQCETD